LIEEGAILELNLNKTVSRFEEKQTRHYHFRCEKCGKVFDLDEPVNPDIDKLVAAKTGFHVISHYTEFHGRCKDCQKIKKFKQEEKSDTNG
jgi:Fe2+ or Zn2+ uptake regulation protein